MTVNIGVLGQVLFSPMKAFESIVDKTTMMDGIVMYIILALIGAIIGLIPVMGMMGGFMGQLIVGIVISIVIGVILFVVIGWLSSVLAKAIFKGSGDMGATVGLLGYAGVVNLVMTLLRMVLTMAGIALVAVTMVGYTTASAGPTAIGWVMVLVGFIWTMYVSGSAVAVANKTSLVGGAVSYFLAALIVGIIVGMVLVGALMSMGVSISTMSIMGGGA